MFLTCCRDAPTFYEFSLLDTLILSVKFNCVYIYIYIYINICGISIFVYIFFTKICFNLQFLCNTVNNMITLKPRKQTNCSHLLLSCQILEPPSNQRRNKSLTFNPALRKGHQILPKKCFCPSLIVCRFCLCFDSMRGRFLLFYFGRNWRYFCRIME